MLPSPWKLHMSPYRLHPQACGKEGLKPKKLSTPNPQEGLGPPLNVGNWLSEDVIFGSALSKHEGAKLGTMGFSVCAVYPTTLSPGGQALGFRARPDTVPASGAHCPCT